MQRRGGGGGGEDRISGLPVELLLDVLGRLGCVREAARTSVLSRRWRDLWAELRELQFDGVGAGALEPALALVRPKLHRLDLWVPADPDLLTGSRVSSLLRAADRLEPAELAVRVDRDTCTADPAPFELPCFGSATSFDLFVPTLDFTLAPAGKFASLRQLTLNIDFDSFAHLGGLLPRCPCLRRLKMNLYVLRRNSPIPIPMKTTKRIEVKSKSLKEATLSMAITGPAYVGIVAPRLRKLGLRFDVSEEIKVSHSVPKVEEFMLMYNCNHSRIGFGDKWRRHQLVMSTKRINSYSNGPRARVRVLSLTIISPTRPSMAHRTFAQELARLPVTDFSVLELFLRPEGHVFGALLLHLLRIRTSIRRLKLVLLKQTLQMCSQNCDCDQDSNWRDEQIFLLDLEGVEIQGFNAADHEMDFLELVFRSAPMLKRMNIKLSAEVSRSVACQKLRNVFEANASVTCNVYGAYGDKISFA